MFTRIRILMIMRGCHQYVRLNMEFQHWGVREASA
jgi:hypothetical protein